MIVAVVFGIAFAAVSYRLAARRGRRPALWAALGFVFGLFALITLRLLPARTAVSMPVSA
jgi:threonine/homoserine/homoserine lactone efflux protein